MAFSSITPIDSGKEVTCTLCRQPYCDPRLLPCLHAFCFDCLKQQLDDSNQRQADLLCPTCSERSPLPLIDLPSHVYLRNQANAVRRVLELKGKGECENCNSEGKACAFCSDCGDSGLRICERCVECHKTFKVFKNHTFVSLESDLTEFVRKTAGKESMSCVKHTSVVLKYFCQVCNVLVCSECCVFDHFGHEFKEVSAVLVRNKAEIQSACLALKPAPRSLSHAEGVLKDAINDVEVCHAGVKRKIEDAFVPLLMAVEKRKKELLADAEAMAVAKTTRLRMQREDLKKLNAAMKLNSDCVQRGTWLYSAAEFLAIQKVMKDSCLSLKKRFASASLDPVDSVPMAASVNVEDAISAVGNVGSVEERLPCSPSHCSLVGINKKFSIGIAAGAQRVLIVQTRNKRGEPMKAGEVNVKAWVSTHRERICDVEVSNFDQGKYTLRFCVQKQDLGKGFCVQKQCSAKAHITADGEDIDGSPFDVTVRDYAQGLGSGVWYRNQSSPTHVCVSHNRGDFFVALASGDVRVYSYQYHSLKSTIGSSTIGVRNAYGIVVDEENEVMYITCTIGNKVVKTTLDGKLISSVGSVGSGHLQFKTPMGLCLDAASNLYIADYGNQGVQVLGPDLVFKKEFKCQGGSRGVAVDSFGTLHVATDSGLESFPDKLQSFFQERHSCQDIAISPEGYKFVTYSGRGEAGLEIHNPNGDVMKAITYTLQDPRGVFLDQSGQIYIADYGAQIVFKY